MKAASSIATGIIGVALLSSRPAAGLTFSKLQSKSIIRNRGKSHRITSTRVVDDVEGHRTRAFNQRIRISLSSLHLSKYTESTVEEEPTIVDVQQEINGSSIAELNGAGSSQIESIDGDTTIINGEQQQLINERALGILVLMTVPLAWGTYTPVVKYMYEKMDPSMPGFVFSAGYYLVAAASLGFLSSRQDDSSNDAMGGNNKSEELVSLGDGTAQSDEDENAIITRGGWELGSYLFIGNGLQVVGLQTVPADRAAFLVQLTTVMVPLISAISAGKLSAVPLQTWIACIIAFAGVIIMGADDGASADSAAVSVSAGSISDGSATIEGALSTGIDSHPALPFSIDLDQLSSSLQLSQGDFLIVLAAVSYTMHVVRLGAYAPRTTPLKLAASKATTEAFLSVLLVMVLTLIGTTHLPSPEFISETGNSVSEYFKTIYTAFAEGGLTSNANESSLGVSIGAILWTGWVTCAYTIYAQSFGQRRVNPTDSNLIYTTQPLFSSLFAYFLLGETLGFYGYVGATFIGAALYLVSFSEGDSKKD